MLTCGQSVPHTSRSGAWRTSACAIGVTVGYGIVLRVQRIGPDIFTHTRPVSSMRSTVCERRLIDAAAGGNAGEVIEHDGVGQCQQLVGVVDDIGAVRIELHMPAVVRRVRRDIGAI